MFVESFKITGSAVIQICLLGVLGYFLAKKNILGEEGLNAISRLTLDIALPLLIFAQLIKEFSFSVYPNWWVFPLLSLAITLLGLVVGMLFSWLIKGSQHKAQFVSLVSFQNSGYLPLALIAALLPPELATPVFIYLFLFLFGFNLVMFSLGVFILSYSKEKKFEMASLFSPPVIACLLGLAGVFFGLPKIMPDWLIKPMRVMGDCTLPLAMLVVGGSLASIHLKHIDIKAMIYLALAKLVVLPLIGLWVVTSYPLPHLVALLIILQLAAPPATTLSLLVRHYKKEDLLVSQGIFFGHILSLISIPVFLSIYFALVVIK
ncbi:MAG: AEC family transporter [Candidatus Omnitrophica bacterium]|nr:AEC family transporter [Candidatus Omnitrophota bacterium]